MRQDPKESPSYLDQLPSDIILRTALHLYPQELFNDKHPLLQVLDDQKKNLLWNTLLELDFSVLLEDVKNDPFATLSPQEKYQMFYQLIFAKENPLHIKLYFTVKRGNFDEVKAIIKHKHNDNLISFILRHPTNFVDITRGLPSPFELAAEKSDEKIFNLFIAIIDRKKNNPSKFWSKNYDDIFFKSNFYRIFETGSLKNLQILIKKFPDYINEFQRISLSTNVKKGRMEIFSWLIKQYQAMQLPIALPLEELLKNNHGDLALQLIQELENIKLETPLHIALEHKQLQLAEVLIQAGINVNKPNYWGITPLHVAAKQGLTKILNRLITEKTLNTRHSASDFTPLHLAAQNGHIETVLELLAAGAVPENIIPGQGDTQILDNHAKQFKDPKMNDFMCELITTFNENHESWDTLTNKKTSAEIIIAKIKTILNAWIKSAEENLPNLISRSPIFQPAPTQTLIKQIKIKTKSWENLDKTISPVKIASDIKELTASISTEDDKCYFKPCAAFLLFQLEKLKSTTFFIPEIQQEQPLNETLRLLNN